jgi:Fe2+ transport system protein FeoA
MQQHLKPLCAVKNPASLVFVTVRGGPVKRLQDMGFVPGEKFRIVNNADHGPVMIVLKGTTLAIGAQLACKIMVREA